MVTENNLSIETFVLYGTDNFWVRRTVAYGIDFVISYANSFALSTRTWFFYTKKKNKNASKMTWTLLIAVQMTLLHSNLFDLRHQSADKRVQDIEAQDISAQDISAQDISAQDIRAKT